MKTFTKKPTIYEIAYIIKNESYSHYFDRKTLKFFRQTLKSFTVKLSPMGNVYVYGDIYSPHGYAGRSFAQFVHVDGDMNNTQMKNIPGIAGVYGNEAKMDFFLKYVEQN